MMSPAVVIGDKLLKPALAVVALVPPLAIGNVPVTPPPPPAAKLMAGMSALAIVRNIGVPAEPFGAAKKVLAVCDTNIEGVTFWHVGAALSLSAVTTFAELHAPTPAAATKLPVKVPEEFDHRTTPVDGVPGNTNCSPDAATAVGATI